MKLRLQLFALVFLQCCNLSLQDVCLGLTASPALEPYVDPVPVMPRISLQHTSASKPFVIGAYKTTQKLHRDLPATTIYAFGRNEKDAATPGPTLVVKKDVGAHVRWENHIRDVNHTLAVDTTIPRAEPPRSGVPLVVHLHGGVTQPDSDGHPNSWITAAGDKGPNYTTNTFHYSNAQPPTMLWYHDHSYGYTRLSVAAGLAGAYLIISPKDDPSWLPTELRESMDENKFIHHLIIQDKQLFKNGSLNYPTIGLAPNAHPSWCIEYLGDLNVVNGKIWPYLNVTRGVHRFRFLNGANARFFLLSLSNNMSFVKIGTDGGYLNTPVRQTQLRMAPAERVDALIDFSSLQPGTLVTMSNTGASPFPSGTPPTNTSLMQFRVGSEKGPSVPKLPLALAPNQTIQQTLLQSTGLDISKVDFNRTVTRKFLVDVQLDATGSVVTLYIDVPRTFRDPATEIVRINTDEVWEFTDNARTDTGVSHPIHIHLTNFVVLSQQMYNGSRFTTKDCSFNFSFPDPRSCFTEPPQVPDADQLGWKDTAVIQPFKVTRFYVPFFPRDRKKFPFDATRSPGYVWHCHILEHEDNEMMRPLLFFKNRTRT